MNRAVIIIFSILNITQVMSQASPFDSVVNQLHFGIDVATRNISMIDSFSKISQLRRDEVVIRQCDLNRQIYKKSKEGTEMVSHVFRFTDSPLPNQKIELGEIIVRTTESRKSKEILYLQWKITFATMQDATNFFDGLKKLFSNVSTNLESENIDGTKDHVHYLSSTENQRLPIRISAILKDSLITKTNEIVFIYIL
jgi:hypothetical protein